MAAAHLIEEGPAKAAPVASGRAVVLEEVASRRVASLVFFFSSRRMTAETHDTKTKGNKDRGRETGTRRPRGFPRFGGHRFGGRLGRRFGLGGLNRLGRSCCQGGRCSLFLSHCVAALLWCLAVCIWHFIHKAFDVEYLVAS